MAAEILAVPEEHLAEVIRIIRDGLECNQGAPATIRRHLAKWCKEEEDYLRRLARNEQVNSVAERRRRLFRAE